MRDLHKVKLDVNTQELSMLWNGLDSFFVMNVEEDKIREALLKRLARELRKRGVVSINGKEVK